MTTDGLASRNISGYTSYLLSLITKSSIVVVDSNNCPAALPPTKNQNSDQTSQRPETQISSSQVTVFALQLKTPFSLPLSVHIHTHTHTHIIFSGEVSEKRKKLGFRIETNPSNVGTLCVWILRKKGQTRIGCCSREIQAVEPTQIITFILSILGRVGSSLQRCIPLPPSAHSTPIPAPYSSRLYYRYSYRPKYRPTISRYQQNKML